jgi:hypothetical protein
VGLFVLIATRRFRNMYLIGIDPGLSGAVARISTIDGSKAVWDAPPGNNYPDPRLCAEMMREIVGGEEYAIAIEQTSVRPGQGVSACHHFGIGAGVWLGVAYSLRAREIRIVRPQVWMKDIWGRYGAHGEDTKQRTYQAMCGAHPDFAAKLVTARGKLLDGRSDALAIATHLRDNISRIAF